MASPVVSYAAIQLGPLDHRTSAGIDTDLMGRNPPCHHQASLQIPFAGVADGVLD